MEKYDVSFYFEFDRSNKVLRAVLEGAITNEELQSVHRQVSRYAALMKPTSGIFDLSAVSSFELSSEEIRDLARQEPAFGGAPRCIVAPSDHNFGLARMFQIVGEQTRPDLHVARTMGEAFRCLGIPFDALFEQIPNPSDLR